MTCPHSTKPGPCSQCAADVKPRIVTQEGGSLLVDGVVERPIDQPAQQLPPGSVPRKQRRRWKK